MKFFFSFYFAGCFGWAMCGLFVLVAELRIRMLLVLPAGLRDSTRTEAWIIKLFGDMTRERHGDAMLLLDVCGQ
jgi:hypothetical protein